MMKRLLPLFLVPVTLVACEAMGAHTGVVARVGQHDLTIDRTVDLLVDNPRIPATTEVVASIADLWVDYTILAEVLSRDTTLATLDLEPLVEPYEEQRIFTELRQQIMTQDTVVGDEELRRLFEEQAPGRRVRARHILFRFPDDPTPAQREQIQQEAEEVRQRAVEGEDFGELARRYSEDPGSAPRGGDLETAARMRVPETAMHEYRGVMLRERDVRRAGQAAVMQPETEPLAMERASQQQLGLRILGTDGRHDAAPVGILPGNCGLDQRRRIIGIGLQDVKSLIRHSRW
jgi:hypothetical protein